MEANCKCVSKTRNCKKKEGDTYYIVDTPRLLALAVQGEKWKNVGVPELYGKISIITTHPAKSNSGNIVNNGEVVTRDDLPTVWSSHPFIALTDNGDKLKKAL